MSELSGRESAVIEVAAKDYSLEAAQKTAHRFLRRAHAEVASDGPTIKVKLTPLSDLQNKDELRAEFLDLLLDQSLREKLEVETASLRNLIVAHALSETVLIAEEQEFSEPLDDPDGAMVPDDEK